MKPQKRAATEIKRTNSEASYFDELGEMFDKGSGTTTEKLENFAKYVPRQSLSLFLAKYDLFKRIVNIHGSIVECGVHLGGGLMTFAQISAILEPVNYTRKVIGFDTFGGFPGLSKKDAHSRSELAKTGGFAISGEKYEDLKGAIEMFDRNRLLNHIPKVELVKGDATKTIPRYLKENPHTVVSLLYLDFDLFEPTKVAIENFLPRMPKGAIIGFDELNLNNWPGETLAVLETVGINSLRIRRVPFVPSFSYAILE